MATAKQKAAARRNLRKARGMKHSKRETHRKAKR